MWTFAVLRWAAYNNCSFQFSWLRARERRYTGPSLHRYNFYSLLYIQNVSVWYSTFRSMKIGLRNFFGAFSFILKLHTHIIKVVIHFSKKYSIGYFLMSTKYLNLINWNISTCGISFIALKNCIIIMFNCLGLVWNQ